MVLRNWRYRAGQFWSALFTRPRTAELDTVRQLLTPRQFALFERMQPSEQAHAIGVMRNILARPERAHPDLLVAALLHDVGKARYPLRLWERVIIVLGRAVLPRRAQAWGRRQPRGWVRPFVVAARHPAWGAEMAAEAGVSPLARSLIRRHQDRVDRASNSLEDRLLAILQAADDEN